MLFNAGKIMLLVGVVAFGFVGLVMLWGAWYLTKELRAFLPLSLPATGKVIEFKTEVSKDSDGHKSVSYYPIIEFSTKDNQKVKFQSKLAVDQYKYPVGESIKILYNRSNPDDARIDSFDNLWGTTILLVVMGVAFVSGALLVYFILYKEVEVGVLFIAGGFAFAVGLLYAGGWWLSQDSIYLLKHGVRTTGTVIDFNPAPLVEFTTKDGKIVKHQSNVSSTPPKYSQGDSVKILYDPNEPSRASIDSFDEMWLFASVMGGMGTIFLLACIYAIYLRIRNGS